MFYVRKKSLGSFYSRGTIFYCLVATLLCGAVAHCESLLEGLEEVLECLIDILVLLVELVLVGAFKLVKLLLKVLAGLCGANGALPSVVTARIVHDVVAVLGLDNTGVADLSATVGSPVAEGLNVVGA